MSSGGHEKVLTYHFRHVDRIDTFSDSAPDFIYRRLPFCLKVNLISIPDTRSLFIFIFLTIKVQ